MSWCFLHGQRQWATTPTRVDSRRRRCIGNGGKLHAPETDANYEISHEKGQTCNLPRQMTREKSPVSAWGNTSYTNPSHHPLPWSSRSTQSCAPDVGNGSALLISDKDIVLTFHEDMDSAHGSVVLVDATGTRHSLEGCWTNARTYTISAPHLD